MTFANPNSRLNPSRPQAFSIHEPAPPSEGGNPTGMGSLGFSQLGRTGCRFRGNCR